MSFLQPKAIVSTLTVHLTQLARMVTDTIVHGWHDRPTGRGTFDIIKTCAGTIFLLCWSSVCPNVPSPKSGFWAKFANKLCMFLLAILGPDFIFMTAMGQLNTAWRAKKAFRQNGYLHWTLRHCFFANMGGVHLEFRDRKIVGLSSFPVDCEQLLYLVQHNYMTLPEISEEDIHDRNKADELARGIAIIQVLWFTANAFGRVAQGLFLTTMELTTLAFVFQMICSSLCWWCKPMDISRPMKICVDTDLATVLREATALQTRCGQTPLSFINRRESFLSRLWLFYMQNLRTLRLLPSRTYKPAEADHFLSVEFPETELKWDLCFGWTIPAYSAIFMTAWDITFPSLVERTLWRVAAVYCLLFGFIGCAIAGYFDNQLRVASCGHAMTRYLGWKTSDGTQTASEKLMVTDAGGSRFNALLRRTNKWFDWMRNRSQDHDPLLALPLRLVLPATVLCALYCLARLYLLVEDVVGLRSLPASAFRTVDWEQYSPVL